ncbi:hypothetical protein NKR74_21705 [Bacillus sp. 3103sda1]|uniref:hypothetical protein n=1 Tax=Bacillus sp. 3103sda1 TaxID=2953808 RepID=UPI0020A0C4F9|nr:hypothetical protein [Bacillus sp. 3103sda1]MCP1125888.1 hypothetical protein [Bacillus sp. 3103sda1]
MNTREEASSLVIETEAAAISEEVNAATETQVSHLEKVSGTMKQLIVEMSDLEKRVEQFKIEN